MAEKPHNLTLNQQNYLETIYELTGKHGHAHTKDIAERLKVRMASVTEAVQGLAAAGMVNYQPRRAITLTARGNVIARELERRHSVLQEFYGRVLGLDKTQADKIACRVEHVVTPSLTSSMSCLIEFLTETECCGRTLLDKFREKRDAQINED